MLSLAPLSISTARRSDVRSLAPRLEPDFFPGSKVALVSTLPRETMKGLHRAARLANVDARVVSDVDQLRAMLGGSPPRAVVVDLEDPAFPSIAAITRSDPMNAHIPVLGVARNVGDSTYASALACGASDVIDASRAETLAAILTALDGTPPSRTPERRGLAVVAHPERQKRDVVASILAAAGYSVEMAGDLPTLSALVAEEPSLCFASTALFGALRALLGARERGLLMPWVLSTTADRLNETRALTEPLEGVAVTDEAAAPDSVLFLSNELRCTVRPNLRATPRVLHGTRVFLHAATGVVTGFSYNISEGGLFVRTLSPMRVGDEVGIDLVAPLSSRVVRPMGRVAWQRPFGPLAGAISPPGVGLHVTTGAPDDWSFYRQQCRRLASQHGW
jgi:Tfp pilus assembly protein PilZ